MVLRSVPPMDLLERFFLACGVRSFQTPTLFLKEHIVLSEIESLLPEVESYYIPCKAHIYIHPPLTQLRCITIAKHILRANGMDLLSMEKTVQSVKQTYYQIRPTRFDATSETQVSFN